MKAAEEAMSRTKKESERCTKTFKTKQQVPLSNTCHRSHGCTLARTLSYAHSRVQHIGLLLTLQYSSSIPALQQAVQAIEMEMQELRASIQSQEGQVRITDQPNVTYRLGLSIMVHTSLVSHPAVFSCASTFHQCKENFLCLDLRLFHALFLHT